MSMPTKDHFFFEIGEASEELKTDLYGRLKKIENRFVEGKIAASKTDTSHGRVSIGSFLKGISLYAPNLEIADHNGELIGSISLPSDLQDFMQIFCLGSTHTAYHILKISKLTVRNSINNETISLITDLQPKTYFIDIVDRLYKYHIGNNPKYAHNEPIQASIEQLRSSQIFVYKKNTSKEAVVNNALLFFQNIFDNEPRAIGDRSLHPILDGYCQVCHRPNSPNKKYCHAHEYDPVSRNSPAKTPLRWAEKAFRNLGLLLDDEVGLSLTKPNTYIEEAKEKRVALAKDRDKQKAIESEILSEYCIKLEGWAKHHPLYFNFYEALALLLIKYKDTLNLTSWDNQSCLNLINEVIELCGNAYFIPNHIFPEDLKEIPTEEIKSILLGPDGLDIKLTLQDKISIDDWATMICRYYQFELAFMCRKKDKASLLHYFRFDSNFKLSK
ncbi:hypothetical protein MGA5115_01829 [Marinomonas gallaica]|uniref:Uncharacterized protein n=1 Tax=Marinomonas gallaica TaxID=1806667 RepID=A0A1C3JR83_9GAMM|nr:hypothetical protein [Marinomonas gallaica]SBT17713.1 hypothetical protein MGA5115_01829 [Marinomonas gallaica]SBT20039.1 hypothetical protein MGA5116_00622 [Marinomonas gallaica]